MQLGEFFRIAKKKPPWSFIVVLTKYFNICTRVFHNINKQIQITYDR